MGDICVKGCCISGFGARMRIDISDDDMHGAVGVGWGGSSGTDHVQRFMLLEIYTLTLV